MISPLALREISQLQHQAETILAQRSVSRADQKKADLILSKIANIRSAGFSSDEQRQLLAGQISREIGLPVAEYKSESPEQRAHETLFRHFLAGHEDGALHDEQRSSTLMQAGNQTPVFTLGPQGGFLVPQSFSEKVAEAQALVDPLLDPALVSMNQEDGYKLPPLDIPGFDVSTIAASKTSESVAQNAGVIPAVDGKLLGRYTYRATVVSTLELETDAKAYGSLENALARAFGVAMARGIGADLINGDGTTGPAGALTFAANSGITTAAAGAIGLADINGIYFSVNPIYRQSDRCAWLMHDNTWKTICSAVDSTGRPLLPIDEDNQTLKGKAVRLSPSMPYAPGSKAILFGSFENYFVHTSTLLIQRRVNSPGLAEYGKVAFTALQMADACLYDASEGASSGAFSPIKFCTLHA